VQFDVRVTSFLCRFWTSNFGPLKGLFCNARRRLYSTSFARLILMLVGPNVDVCGRLLNIKFSIFYNFYNCSPMFQKGRGYFKGCYLYHVAYLYLCIWQMLLSTVSTFTFLLSKGITPGSQHCTRWPFHKRQRSTVWTRVNYLLLETIKFSFWKTILNNYK